MFKPGFPDISSHSTTGFHSPTAPSPCAACKMRDQFVCSVLEGEELERLNAIMTEVTFNAGDTIFSEGEEADYIFNVTFGTLKLYKLLPDGRSQITGFITVGDFLGLSNTQSYSCTAEAITDIQICRFKRTDLEKLLNDFPKMGKRLLGMARNELAEIQDQLLLLGRKTADERLASFLANMSKRKAFTGETPNTVNLVMNQNEVGEYLGMTPETVSRTMKRFRDRGIIAKTKHSRKISIIDTDALKALECSY